ncbi:pentapeptide repeat-containing protein [Leptothoe sp. PORK10 BA2]|uniref:pentapeptide repeat-containing protein n=1 Tax=Leptothoe sp. PORK10 BA2 TaxID=3110254 RepID=UPI002B20F26C|nr:pentapeptide repeat-containing protein [Leptothoe sp. PORK10 BA2]MEA5462869.1 pentapeptide repeat-containing protein [Leptothoe sp. PORK10 BA2]
MADDLRNQLLDDFEQLANIPKLFDREYERIRRAQAFEAAHGLSPDEYNRLFELYLTDKHLPDWLEKIAASTKRFHLLVQTLQSFASLAILISAIQFLYGFRERQNQIFNNKWGIVASDIRVGSTKKNAIEYLHDREELLSNIEAVDTQLSYLNLPGGARLQETDFRGANLYHAYFEGANLYRSDFSNYDQELTNLEGVNFQLADLRQVNFQGANLKVACFREANLETANFANAYLVGADFRGARYLTADQIRAAGQDSYSRALFDDALSQDLGLAPADGEPAEGCRIRARDRNWWQAFIGH